MEALEYRIDGILCDRSEWEAHRRYSPPEFEAYRDGRGAAEQALEEWDNPYGPLSDCYGAWAEGFADGILAGMASKAAPARFWVGTYGPEGLQVEFFDHEQDYDSVVEECEGRQGGRDIYTFNHGKVEV